MSDWDALMSVIEDHFYDTGWRCSCGWTGSCDEWSAHLATKIREAIA